MGWLPLAGQKVSCKLEPKVNIQSPAGELKDGAYPQVGAFHAQSDEDSKASGAFA